MQVFLGIVNSNYNTLISNLKKEQTISSDISIIKL